jgi:fumarate reductase flavoprotein subunit
MPKHLRVCVFALTLLLAWSASMCAQTMPTTGNLASLHMGKAQVTCKACHVEGDPKTVTPEQSLASANGQCISCHGDAGKLAEALAPKLANRYINPHASHLVAIDCTTCHGGHAATSESYCLKCHEFNMPMPGAARSAK